MNVIKKKYQNKYQGIIYASPPPIKIHPVPPRACIW